MRHGISTASAHPNNAGRFSATAISAGLVGTIRLAPDSIRYDTHESTIGAVLQCGGVDDTAELNAAISGEGIVSIPKGKTCAASGTVSFSSASTLRIERGGLLKPVAGQTIIISGQLEAGPYQIFANALPGQGNVRLSPNAPVSTIYPEWWGPNQLDWSPAFQQASNNRSGRTIELQATTYRLDSVVTFNTTQTERGVPNGGFRLLGKGSLSTVIDSHVVNGPAFRLYGNAANGPNPSFGFDFHTIISDFKISSTGAATGSSGIEISSNWYLRIERVWIENLSGDGIRLDNNSNALDDANSTIGFVIRHCVIRNNRGYGIRTRQSQGFIAIGLAEISYCYIAENGLAGIMFTGQMLKVEGNSIAQNRGGGLYVPAESPNLTLRILGNEFESNVPYNLNIARCIGGIIEGNHFNASDVDANNLLRTTTDIILGDDKGGDNPPYYVDRVALRQNRFRANFSPGVRGNIGIDLKQNSRWCTIEGSNWTAYQFLPITGTVSTNSRSPLVSGSGTDFSQQASSSSWIQINGQTRRVSSVRSGTSLAVSGDFASTSSGITALVAANLRVQDSGIGNQFRDDGEQVVEGWKWFSTTVSRPELITQIDLLNGLFQRIVFNAGGRQTVTIKAVNVLNNPAPILSLELLNNVDNSLSIAFDSSFVIKNFVTPGQGNSTRCLFIFNPGQSNKWTQLGEWTTSESFARAGGTYAAVPTSAPEITRNENDYNPGGSSLYQRWKARSTFSITGLTFTMPQVDGQTHYLINVGSADIVLKNENAGSKAENRFLTTTGSDLAVSPNQMALCIYDGSSARWRCSKLN